MKDMDNNTVADTEYKPNRCGEHPNIFCQLGRYYPFCDMSCAINSFAQDQIRTLNKEEGKS